MVDASSLGDARRTAKCYAPRETESVGWLPKSWSRHLSPPLIRVIAYGPNGATRKPRVRKIPHHRRPHDPQPRRDTPRYRGVNRRVQAVGGCKMRRGRIRRAAEAMTLGQRPFLQGMSRREIWQAYLMSNRFNWHMKRQGVWQMRHLLRKTRRARRADEGR